MVALSPKQSVRTCFMVVSEDLSGQRAFEITTGLNAHT